MNICLVALWKMLMLILSSINYWISKTENIFESIKMKNNGTRDISITTCEIKNEPIFIVTI